MNKNNYYSVQKEATARACAKQKL